MSAPCLVVSPAVPLVSGKWISSAAEFQRLGAEWNALFSRAGNENVFLSFGWMSTWWKHFGKGKLAVVAIRDESGRLVAVAPFYVARSQAGLGARRLGFLADRHVGSDYLDVLSDPAFHDLAVQEIARVIFAHRVDWDYIELCDTGDSPLAAALPARLESGGMRTSQTERRVCYFIPLPDTFDQFLASLGTSLRCNYRRRWKILQREHQGTCLAVSSAAEVARHFPKLMELHRMRFEQRAADSAFLAHGVPEFHLDAMRELAAQGLVRLILLQAGGETVSAIYGFSVGTTFQFYQCGMHTGWMRHGVGQVLIGNAIEQALSAGHTTFDFLRGDESYKTQWTSRSRETVTLLFFDGRAASLRARWSLQASAALHRVARGLRSRLKQTAERARAATRPQPAPTL